MSSELELLARIVRDQKIPGVILPNGDDASVVRIGSELIAITTDTVVEDRHFSFAYYSPAQAGAKAVEAAVSDLIAVGATPKALVLALTLPGSGREDKIERLYDGIYAACARLGCALVGGDITTGSKGIELAVTAIGRVPEERLICRRSGAEPGDAIFLTAPLGGSCAGLRALQSGIPEAAAAKKKHLEPRCRLDMLGILPPIVHSMIDISDGLSSEIHHICSASRCGAVIEEDKIPIAEDAKYVAGKLGENVLDYVMNGGEDYELLFTASPESAAATGAFPIGRITAESGIFLESRGELRALPFGGFDHLR